MPTPIGEREADHRQRPAQRLALRPVDEAQEAEAARQPRARSASIASCGSHAQNAAKVTQGEAAPSSQAPIDIGLCHSNVTNSL